MRTYRLTFHLRGAYLTPWQADILFGHLCWALRWNGGRAAVNDLLARYHEGDVPLLLSDGFPDGWLPRPAFPRPVPAGTGKRDDLQRSILAHERRARGDWLTLDEFNAWRAGPERWEADAAKPGDEGGANQDRADAGMRTLFKNRINRNTGTTTGGGDDAADGGSLYAVEERFLHENQRLTVYARIAGDWLDTAKSLLSAVARTGFGGRKSVGYGQFDFDPASDMQPFDRFDAVPEANGFVSLSNWVPAAADPTDGYYRAWVKHGRLGEVYAQEHDEHSPFKQPLVMLRAGSCFRVAEPRPFYGRLVPGVHREDGEIVQYGLAFDLPVRFGEP